MNSTLKGAQKILASLTMTTTVMSLAGFAALVPTTALAVTPADYGLVEGWTISADGATTDANFDPDIYIVNDWGYKRLFLNPVIFGFYGHLGGFAAVHKVSPATRDAFGTSGLFRNCETNDPKVYGVEVTAEDTGILHWVNTTGAQAVLDDPNFFRKVFCINNNEFNWYPKGSDYTSVNQVPNYNRTSPTPTPGAGLSVSLASDNPAANTLIAGQAAADLAHFTFSGSGTVTSVTLQRLGVSADTTLANVYLYEGSRRLTDAATVSSGKITFNSPTGLFTVNGSTTIAVKSDIAASTQGQTVGVQLTSYNGITTSLSGNLMTIATAPSDFGGIAVGTSTPSTEVTIDPQLDYTMWQNVVSVTNHDLWLKSLQLRVIGSVLSTDLRNFRLYVDGVQIGSAVAMVDANGYVVFDLNANPFVLKTGSRTIKMVGDVIGGSNRNFTISLRQKPDIYAVDTQYGQAVLATGTFPSSTAQQNIAQGSLTITKQPGSPSGDVIKDAAGVTLAKFDFKAFGEQMKVENLRVNFDSSDENWETLRNGSIYADGVQIGSTATIWEDSTTSTSNSTAYTEFSLGSSLIVAPGTTRVVEIRADIYDSNGVNDVTANDTIAVALAAGSSNVQRLTSLNYISSDAATANTLTVKTGSFTAAKFTGYANQSVVAPQSNYKLGHYTLTAASSEDINVNTVTIDINGSGSFLAADLTNVYLIVKSDTGATVQTTSPKSTVSATASNSYSVNFTMPKTKTYQVEVWGTIGSSIGTDTLSTDMDAAGLTASSATTVTAAEVTGQTLTGASATLNLANGSNPPAKLAAGSTTQAAYVFTLTPQYDSFTLDDATFKLDNTAASSTGAVGMMNLKNSSGTVIASSPITTLSSAAFAMSGINYAMPNGTTQTFTVEVVLNSVGIGGNDTGGDVTVQLSHLKYHDSNGNITTSVVDPATYTGNQINVTKSYPSFANVALPDTVLAAGEKTLFKSNVSAVGGQVAWRKVVFTISTTATPTLNGFKLYENGVDISSLASATTSGNGGGTQFATNSKAFSTAGAGTGTVVFVFNTDRTISAGGSVTLELKGTIGGTNTAGNSVTTQVANPGGSTFVASDDVLSLGGSATTGWRTDVNPSFLWSDTSAASHASTTDDWMGDSLLQGIAAAQSLFQ